MAKVSMKRAADLFAVSRPTLLKHLRDGKISGEKTVKGKNEFWEIDMAELARVYPRRDNPARDLPANFTNPDMAPAPDLSAEIRVLQAKLEAAQAMIEEKDKRIEDLRRMLPGADESPSGRKWWRFGR